MSVRNSTGEVHRSNSPGFEESPYESRSKFSNPLSIESVLKSDDRAKEVL